MNFRRFQDPHWRSGWRSRWRRLVEASAGRDAVNGHVQPDSATPRPSVAASINKQMTKEDDTR
jgi:hypothetical protein